MKYDAGLITAEVLHQQHSRLEQLFCEITDVAMIPNGHPTINVLVEELIRLIGEHCAAEEAFMRQTQYPHMPEHQLQHKLLLGEGQRILAGVKGNLIPLALAVKGLMLIVKDHRMDTDADMLAYAAQRAVRTPC